MRQAECRLVWYELHGHVQQVYTGFLMLHRRGLIRLSQCRSSEPLRAPPEPHLKHSAGSQLGVVVNGAIKVHYDCHDAVELNPDRLEDCDLYFKRSFSSAYVRRLGAHAGKVLPLGLYYRVLPDTVDLHTIRRAFVACRGARERLAALLDAVDAGNRLKSNPRVRHFEALPPYDLPAKVLFLAAAHDPHAKAGRPREKVEEMVHINDTRAQCIRVLRRELGPRFLGGFMRTPFASRAYKDVLVENDEITRKGSYMRLMKSFPIGVATTGLHGSIGAKFAEYVAAARAIVSEPLNFEAPGLHAGEHYVEFSSPEQCAQQCARLVADRDERCRLMLNNARYYQSHLRPDVLVLNSLVQVFSKSYAGSPAAEVFA